MPVPAGERYAWDPESEYVKKPPYFEGMPAEPVAPGDIVGARALAVLGDSVTTDHISPAGSIARSSPAAHYLIEHGIEPADFNSYGARRGNHEVMVRGTFANPRLRNALVGNVEGGMTRYLPDGTEMSIFDAAMRYQRDGTPLVDPRGPRVRFRLIARLGGQGTDAARSPGGHRGLVRADPPQQPDRDGDPAARVSSSRDPPFARPDGRGVVRHRGPRRAVAPRSVLSVRAAKPGDPSAVTEFEVAVRIDTPDEAEYYRNGGILQYVLRQLRAAARAGAGV